MQSLCTDTHEIFGSSDFSNVDWKSEVKQIPVSQIQSGAYDLIGNYVFLKAIDCFLTEMTVKNKIMIKREEMMAMKTIALCFKPFLKPEEAMIYCNLGRTQLAKKCDESRVYKNNAGYFKKEDLDRMLAGLTE